MRALPLTLAAAAVVGACMVPALDGDFSVDPNAVTSGGPSSSSSGGEGSTSSSSSSGENASSSSSSGSGSNDSGTDGPSGPTKFCDAFTAPKSVFCSDFTQLPDTEAGRWALLRIGQPQGSLNFEGGDPGQAGRHAHFIVTAHPPAATTNFPSTALVWKGPTLLVDQTMTVRQKVTLDPQSSTYINVSIIQLRDGVLRGLSINECESGTGMCLTENPDENDVITGTKNDVVTPGVQFETEVSLTRKSAGVWASKVGRVGKVLSERTTGGLPTGEAGSLSVLVGGANSGGNGTASGVRIDDVVVTITGP